MPSYGEGSSLWVDGVRVWHNPQGIGHAFVGYRKGVAEQNLIERLKLRENFYRILYIGDNPPTEDYEDTTAETRAEIERSFSRRPNKAA